MGYNTREWQREISRMMVKEYDSSIPGAGKNRFRLGHIRCAGKLMKKSYASEYPEKTVIKLVWRV